MHSCHASPLVAEPASQPHALFDVYMCICLCVWFNEAECAPLVSKLSQTYYNVFGIDLAYASNILFNCLLGTGGNREGVRASGQGVGLIEKGGGGGFSQGEVVGIARGPGGRLRGRGGLMIFWGGGRNSYQVKVKVTYCNCLPINCRVRDTAPVVLCKCPSLLGFEEGRKPKSPVLPQPTHTSQKGPFFWSSFPPPPRPPPALTKRRFQSESLLEKPPKRTVAISPLSNSGENGAPAAAEIMKNAQNPQPRDRRKSGLPLAQKLKRIETIWFPN